MSVHAAEQRMRVMQGRIVDAAMVYSTILEGSKQEVQSYLRENLQTEDLRVEVFIRGNNRRSYGQWVEVRNLEKCDEEK